jgi:hypothetical protein
MKKEWKKIGMVERPKKSLVVVDAKGNVLARKIPGPGKAVKSVKKRKVK